MDGPLFKFLNMSLIADDITNVKVSVSKGTIETTQAVRLPCCTTAWISHEFAAVCLLVFLIRSFNLLRPVVC